MFCEQGLSFVGDKVGEWEGLLLVWTKGAVLNYGHSSSIQQKLYVVGQYKPWDAKM